MKKLLIAALVFLVLGVLIRSVFLGCIAGYLLGIATRKWLDNRKNKKDEKSA